jgi:CO/xanthine dehydrogenase Mo-binding subunit
VLVTRQDTTAGSAGSSSASRQTLMTGGAVVEACDAILDQLRARLGGSVAFDGGEVLVDGVPMGSVQDVLATPIAVTKTYHHPPTTAFDGRGQGDIHAMFTFAAERAVVDVDLDLGLVRVVHVNAAADVGVAINPAGVTGQIEGGTAQGMGLALTEELQVRDGEIRNASFTDYLLPTTLDMPTMVSEYVEDPEPGVPLGIKGAGESSIVVAPAAVAAAIRAATGGELNRIPVTPDDVAGLRAAVDGGAMPRAPEVPGNAALPYYFGLGLGEDAPEEG